MKAYEPPLQNKKGSTLGFAKLAFLRLYESMA
jgi:hypothetical protein